MIGELFELVSNGTGRALVFEGCAGMGKSALLRFLRDNAPKHDIQVLHARGSEFECDFAWGVTRQLFERWTTSAAAEDRDFALSGAARLAAPLLEYDLPVESSHDLHPLVHGLYWMSRNLSERQPLIIIVDDAHWADVESLNMLAYLANRLEDGPIGLVLATVPLEEVSQGALLAAATISPSARLARLESLGIEAMTSMVAEELSGEADARFVLACHNASKGNPLLARELLKDAASAGIHPVASEVSKLWDLAPRRTAVHLLRQLNRLGDHANRVVRAVAVLDVDADPRHCAGVAQLRGLESTTAARELVEAGIFRVGVPFGFAHPIMRGIVYSGLTAQERHQAHRLAAGALHAAGVPIASVARHLLRTLPSADAWVIESLRAAAAESVRDGDPRQAVELLRRALAEPPDAATSSQVLAELGAAELRARDGAAIGHLIEAIKRTSSHRDRHVARLDLGHALVATGRHQQAVDVLSEGLEEAWRAGGGAMARLRSTILVIARVTDAAVLPGNSREAHRERAHAALEGLCAGLPVDRVVRLATSALAGSDLLSGEDLALPPACMAAWALAQSGRLPDADQALQHVVNTARDIGYLLAADTAAGMRATLLFESGRLRAAEQAALAALREPDDTTLAGPGVWLAASALVQTLIELDRASEAQTLLERMGMNGSLPDTAFCLPIRIARGCLMIATGDAEEGARQLIASRRLSIDRMWHHPGIVADYLAPLANALMQTDQSNLALAVLRDELARTRAFGAHRPLAAALRTSGMLSGGKTGLRAFEEAVELLEDSPYVLDRAGALVDLGSALRRSGRRAEGRQRLLAGLELAQECGAITLSGMARSELRLAGGRVRAHQPVAMTLTPAEQRVVAKAAEGMTNKQIAQVLFVTVKTVEWHLGQAYRKLGISRRADLVRALSNMDVEDADEPAAG